MESKHGKEKNHWDGIKTKKNLKMKKIYNGSWESTLLFKARLTHLK